MSLSLAISITFLFTSNPEEQVTRQVSQLMHGTFEKLLRSQRYLINYYEEKKNIHKEAISINAMDITPAMRMVWRRFCRLAFL
jgi:hypothetical protein